MHPALAGVSRGPWSHAGTEKSRSISQVTLYPESTHSECENTAQGWRGSWGSGRRPPSLQTHVVWRPSAHPCSVLRASLSDSPPHLVKGSQIHSAPPKWTFPGGPRVRARPERRELQGGRGGLLISMFPSCRAAQDHRNTSSLKVCKARGLTNWGVQPPKQGLTPSYLLILGRWECTRGKTSGRGSRPSRSKPP